MKITNKWGNEFSVTEGDYVMLRLNNPNEGGNINTRWKVMFIDNDETFVGELISADYSYFLYGANNKGQHTIGLELSDIQHRYSDEEQLCYSDNTTICDCQALCRNK